MSDPENIPHIEVEEERKEGTLQWAPTTPAVVKEDHAVRPVTEADRILGLSPEYSGWDVYNNEARKVDTELVKDWTASLNFLLVFAAIFAAVLTAFIIESKKLLEEDSTSVMAEVMIFYTNNVANGTHTPYVKTDFKPSPSDVTVNCLLFASLSASLATALASVVALQWVANYDAAITRGGSSPEDRAKRRQFRHAGVVWWKMGEIIAMLPLFLYFSVALFLSGLVVWMWSINETVGIVVAAGTCIAVLLYGASTVLSVVFVSAPFRTPLTRFVYSLSQLPFAIIFKLILRLSPSRVPSADMYNKQKEERSEDESRVDLPTKLISWMQRRYSAYSIAHKREDLTVKSRSELGRDVFIWLANQINISRESHRRLQLLVAELPNLSSHLPSFQTTEAPWYAIFDLLGREYLSSLQIDQISPEDRRGMEILQKCHSIDRVRRVFTSRLYYYIRAPENERYWSQYCGPDSLTDPSRPNYLFLLLRDLPSPSHYTTEEIEILVGLAHWRNQAVKTTDIWSRVLALEPVLPSDFFNRCVTLFTQYSRSQSWASLAWDSGDDTPRQQHLCIAKDMVQIAMTKDNLTRYTIGHLIKAYESLVTGEPTARGSSAVVLARPLFYGRTIQRLDSEELVHNLIIRLLSRRLCLGDDGYVQDHVQEIIKMLWLRPSNPAAREWNDLTKRFGLLGLDRATPTDWIKQADQVPHFLEILRQLAKAQAEDPSVNPLWRAARNDGANDPHFVEALQTFDQLMGQGCTQEDHTMLIDLVCRDLEQEPPPDFDNYFTSERLDAIAKLTDPCLQILANCARGVDFVNPFVVSKEYQQQRTPSCDRIMDHFARKHLTNTSPVTLELQAWLWPRFPESDRMYKGARENSDTFSHLQNVFRHPVRCIQCTDGMGHSIFHILHAVPPQYFPANLTLFGSIELRGRRMAPTSSILSIWYARESIPLESFLPGASEDSLRCLTAELDAIKTSRFLLLTLALNVGNEFARRTVVITDLAAVVAGIRAALRLPQDPGSTSILAPLSRRILLLQDRMLSNTLIQGMSAECKAVSTAAIETSEALLAELATKIIFGRCNTRSLFCARSLGDTNPAFGWLPPYDG